MGTIFEWDTLDEGDFVLTPSVILSLGDRCLAFAWLRWTFAINY